MLNHYTCSRRKEATQLTSAAARVLFAGRDVFATPADELVAAIVRREGLAPDNFAPGRHGYLFPGLQLVLRRDAVADSPGKRGWAFECVSGHPHGYDDRDG